jgi:hypothetical protein
VVLVAALGVVAAACDDGGGGTETEVGDLSATEFARKANALCREVRADRRTVLSAIDEPTGEETAARLDEILELDRRLLREVDDLVPPEAEQDTVDELLDRWRDRIRLEERARDATAAGDEGALSGIEVDVDTLDEEADRIAGRLLLNECTRGAS